jgi:hypothetical protein
MNAARVALLFLACLPAQACTRDTMLLESDIPLPRGMVTVRSADIRRTAGTVSGGLFLLSGDVADARSALDLCGTRFESHGWTRSEVRGDANAAECRFTKDSRTVALALRRRSLEPVMSTGSLEVQSAAKP